MGKAIKKKKSKNPVRLIVLPDVVTLPMIPPEETDDPSDDDDDEEDDDDPEETIAGKKNWGAGGLTGCGIPIGGVGLDGLDGPPGIVDGSVARLLSNSVGSMIE